MTAETRLEEMDSKQVAKHCCGCTCLIAVGEFEMEMCAECIHRYPWPLIKATADPFDYALRLASGELIRFHCAKISGDWVELTGSDLGQFPKLPHPCPRGISVRISQIVWVADAPNGS